MSDARKEAEDLLFLYRAGAFDASRTYTTGNEPDFQKLNAAMEDLLAAVIEETDAEDALRGHALRDQASVEKNRRLAQATEARRKALSALRWDEHGTSEDPEP